MKWQVRIVIVSVVVGFILEYNHYYHYYYYHPYPLLNNPNPKTDVPPAKKVYKHKALRLIMSHDILRLL